MIDVMQRRMIPRPAALTQAATAGARNVRELLRVGGVWSVSTPSERRIGRQRTERKNANGSFLSFDEVAFKLRKACLQQLIGIG
jgi:hypothetical protein